MSGFDAIVTRYIERTRKSRELHDQARKFLPRGVSSNFRVVDPNPIMVESAERDFIARCGLPDDEFYADSFTSEADKHGPLG